MEKQHIKRVLLIQDIFDRSERTNAHGVTTAMLIGFVGFIFSGVALERIIHPYK